MKRTKIAAIMVSAMFILCLAVPIMASTNNTLSPGILIAAYNYGIQSQNTIQSENPIQSKNGISLVNMTILFHSDLHSELLPWPLADYVSGANNDDTLGGMARIANLIGGIKAEKGAISESVLTFMDGDFLMGTPFSWLGSISLPPIYGPVLPSVELLLMSPGVLGYTAVAIGNHEFDYSDQGLSTILNNTNITLSGMGGTMPLMLCSNLIPLGTDYYDLGAFIQNNATMTVGGVKIGLFSVIGYGAYATMFFNGHYTILDPIDTAKAEVAYFQSQGVNLIIMLSHSGWKEDEALVNQVDGIDLICSGHDHNLLTTPIVITTPSGNTTIVDAKALGEYLGELEITVNATGTPGQGIGIRNYVPIHVNDSIAEEPITAGIIAGYGAGLNSILAGVFGLSSYDTVIANTTGVPSSGYIAGGETPIGDLLADAIRWQANNVSDTDDYVDFAFVPSGVIRHGFEAASGNITLYDAISVEPLGGVPFTGPYIGWFLCNFYLYGSDVKKVMEFSLLAGGDYFEQVSGLKLSYYTFNLPGSWIVSIKQDFQNGTYAPINNTKLYKVCVNLEGALLLPQIGAMNPMFAVTMRNQTGDALPGQSPYDPSKYVPLILVPNPSEPIPEWFGLVNYLMSDQGGQVDPAYNSSQDRITIYSISPLILLAYFIAQLWSYSQASPNLMLAGILTIVLILFALGVAVVARRP